MQGFNTVRGTVCSGGPGGGGARLERVLFGNGVPSAACPTAGLTDGHAEAGLFPPVKCSRNALDLKAQGCSESLPEEGCKPPPHTPRPAFPRRSAGSLLRAETGCLPAAGGGGN